jgi:alanine-glyoxylate transaminase/serine-glyoxylate transaminase/serine-pyruvate transaminase
LGELKPASRLLMGPGPSNVHPRVLRALSTPLVGHLDPDFLQIMDETQSLLRFVMQTENPLTIPVSGTGSAGMEAAFCNLIEPGDAVLIGVNGVFGSRMCDVAERCGATVHRLEVAWGEVFDPSQIAEALERHPVKVVALVHAETSTGAWQPLSEMAAPVHENGALLLVDAVTSLGGCPVEVDGWGIDICYSGTQKCLSCPPGLAPLTLGPQAVEVLHHRRTKVPSWYLDLTLVEKYWGHERTYHHTAPVSMIYALREALRLIQEEGLEARFQRHERNHRALVAGLEALGLQMHVAPEHRLWTLNTVRIPDGVNDAAVRRRLLHQFNIEIGGGLGALQGKVWRIGLMGESSTGNHVLLFLAALEHCLAAEGYAVPAGQGVAAANEVLAA